MARIPSRSTLRTTHMHLPGPAQAGFRPAAAALAVAAAFTVNALPAAAQPVPQAVIHGGASFVGNGSNLTVTTTNGAGSNHSAINWSSFSVPAGSVTRFVQPSATSTSISRVVEANPSQILGQLASNGRLVLVNPWGIAVGQGAQVDTAGFTASTLAMSDADALAGRLRFGGGSGALLQVDGAIKAQGGDIVLIAPQLHTGPSAVIEAGGAAVLAAGQKVEITGRGLEGILMEVRSGDSAVNLGSLKGDAVGMFAGTLRHSGLVQAHAVSTEGGKVVLKAAGDAIVDGTVSAQSGDRGGSIDVLGQRVGLFSGATLDASGAAGGGQVRVGGDYQGANPDVPNAKAAYVDANAVIRADARQQGDGGRVIVWSDENTRMAGRISARGGLQGGDGGFAEVSGQDRLQFSGRVDLRAPRGSAGKLLLDPNDLVISGSQLSSTSVRGTEFSGGPDLSYVSTLDLSAQLELGNVLLSTSVSPSTTSLAGGTITLASGANVAWGAATALTLHANNGITLAGTVNATHSGSTLHLLTDQGSITQTAGSLRVGRLLAQASGGDVLLDQANHVGVIAGVANTVTGRFVFRNSEDVTVDSVYAPWGSSYGINAVRSSGGVTVRSDAGSVRVRSNVSGGSLQVEAARDVEVQGYVSLVSNGNATLHAGRDVLLGAGRTEDPAVAVEHGSVTITGSSGLAITAGRNVRSSGHGFDIASSSAYDNAVGLSGSGGNTGGVAITAGGDVDFGAQTGITTQMAPVSVTATGGSILGRVTAASGGTVDGSIKFGAPNGSVSFDTLLAQGTGSETLPTARGGDVTINAKGTIQGTRIDTSGVYHTVDQPDASGGNITVVSSAGSISLDQVNADGGWATAGATPGRGGNILLSAAADLADSDPVLLDTSVGTVNLGNTITATGGGAYYAADLAPRAGGQGGVITIKARRDIVFGGVEWSAYIDASGGTGGSSASLGGAAGGMGGKVLLTAGSSITGPWPADIRVVGGDGSNDPVTAPDGGKGGVVDIRAGGGVRLSSIVAQGGSDSSGTTRKAGDGGSVSLVSDHGGISVNWMDAAGGSGAPGGKGGTVRLEAALDIASTVRNTGGGGSTYEGAAGANGGDGGTTTLRFGGMFTGSVDAEGGWGESGGSTNANGGRGGAGGVIDLARTSAGALQFQGLQLLANGGAGGSAAYGSSGVGGSGGNGGTVTVDAQQGALAFAQDPTTSAINVLNASAGRGGYDGAGTVVAANGAAGTVTVRAAGDLRIDANALSLGNAITNLAASSGGVLQQNAALRVENGDMALHAGGALTIGAMIESTIAGDAVVLSASSLVVGTGAGIATPAGRWLVYLPGPQGSYFGTLASGNHALWGRPFGANPPATITEAGNRYLFAPQLGLDIVADPVTKVYDSSASFNLTFHSSGFVDASLYQNAFLQDAAPTFSGSLGLPNATKNVGSYAITQGTLASSYRINSFTGNMATITPATLSLSGLGALGKIYDGTTAATVQGTAAVKALAGDVVSIAGSASGSFADKNVGRAKPVTVSGLSLTGADAGNYLLAPPLLSADITPAPLTVSGLAALGKVYDATTFAALLGTATVTPFRSDVVSLTGSAAGNFADKNVGTAKAVSVTGLALAGADAGNYVLSLPTLTAGITPAPITLGGIVANSRVYDTTTVATLSGTAFASGVLGSDAVTLSTAGLRASFADKNVGTAKPATVSGVALAGVDAANYVLRLPTLAADIMPATITLAGVVANSKVYDATTAATWSGTGLASGVLGRDAVSLSTAGMKASFTDKNVGTAKGVAVSGVALAGADAGNYVFMAPTNLAAHITPAVLTVGGLQATDKIYDATTLATFTGQASVNALAGDTVALAGTATGSFADKNVGTAKPVTLAGLSLTGADAGNYRLAFPALAASITPATVTVAGLAASDKGYDGSTAATVAGGTLGGVLASDAVSFTAGSASFADPNAGTGKAVTLAGSGLAGADAANYRLQPLATLSARITPRPLTIRPVDESKSVGQLLTFAGTEFQPLKTGVGNETIASVSLTSAGAPAEASAGVYAIRAQGATGANGFLAGNYAINYVDGALTVRASSVLAPVNNQVVTFATLFVEEAKTQPSSQVKADDVQKKGDNSKDDIVVTGNACKP